MEQGEGGGAEGWDPNCWNIPPPPPPPRLGSKTIHQLQPNFEPNATDHLADNVHAIHGIKRYGYVMHFIK